MDLDDLDARAGPHEPWAVTSDLDSLIEARGRHDHVAAHELFDLDEWTIRWRFRCGEPARTELAAEVDQVVLKPLAPLVEFRVHRLHLGGRGLVCVGLPTGKAALQA